MKTNLYKLVSFYIFIGLLAVSCQNQDEMFFDPSAEAPVIGKLSLNQEQLQYGGAVKLNVEVTDADAMQTHFTSMLSYMQDHDDILSMMGQSTDYQEDYQNMIDYVKKSGLKIHGFAISTKKKTLLELYKEDVVSYIQTTPQN